MVELVDPFEQLEVDLCRRPDVLSGRVLPAQGGLLVRRRQRSEAAHPVLHGCSSAGGDPVTADLQICAVQVECRRIGLRPLDLGGGEGMPGELEGHQDQMEPPTGCLIEHRHRHLRRAEWPESSLPEVAALPEVIDHGPEDRQLLVGGASLDIDRSQETPGDGLDQLRRDKVRHGALLRCGSGIRNGPLASCGWLRGYWAGGPVRDD